MNSKAKNKEKVGTKSIKKVALASNLAQQENKWGKSLNFRAKIGSETILGHFSISGDHRFEFSGSNVFFWKKDPLVTIARYISSATDLATYEWL